MFHIGNTINHLIETKGLTKRALVIDFQMNESNFYKILRSEHMSTKRLMEFCNYLKVHPSYFFKDVEIEGVEKETEKTFSLTGLAAEAEFEYQKKKQPEPKTIDQEAELRTKLRACEAIVQEKIARIQALERHIEDLKNAQALFVSVFNKQVG